MQNIAAREAKLQFDKMLDSAQREPVLIKKHGRPFAVVLSAAEYEQLKMAWLRVKLAVGEEQARRSEFADPGMEDLIAELDRESGKKTGPGQNRADIKPGYRRMPD